MDTKEAAIDIEDTKDTSEKIEEGDRLQKSEMSASQRTLDETFESLTPYEPEDPPPIEEAVSTPPAIKDQSKINKTLNALASPFKSSKGFHLGKPKKGKRHPEDAADPEAEATMSDDDGSRRKKKGKKSRAGALVRKLGALGSRKQEGVKSEERRASSDASSMGSVKRHEPDEEVETSTPHDGSRYASVEDMPAPLAHEETLSDPEPDDKKKEIDIPSIATTHPVSTLPFARSSWKHKTTPEIEKPIEEPSPEDAARKRISFADQSAVSISIAISDKEDTPDGSPVTKLSRMVELVRQQQSHDQRSPPLSRSPSPRPEPEPRSDEEYEDTTAEDPPPMPAYGDILDAPQAEAVTSNPSTLGSDRREHLYKILVIGELGTGKTSIIKRYVHQFFSQHYRATIGVDFALKVLNWDANTTVRLQLWDIAGQERFGNMTRVYYKEAVGAFVVFDVTRVATFDAVVKWKQDLDSKVQLPDGSPIPCVLLANKCDQQKEGIVNNQAKMEEYCKEKGFSAWFETSAKENINIEEAARALVNRILHNDKFAASGDSKESAGFALDGSRNPAEASSGSKCAC